MGRATGSQSQSGQGRIDRHPSSHAATGAAAVAPGRINGDARLKPEIKQGAPQGLRRDGDINGRPVLGFGLHGSRGGEDDGQGAEGGS